MKLSMVVGSIPWGSDYNFFKFKLWYLAIFGKSVKLGAKWRMKCLNTKFTFAYSALKKA